MEEVPDTNMQDFFNFLFDGLEGYTYVATKDIKQPPEDAWEQHFFKWPEQASDMEAAVRGFSIKLDVYIAPAILSRPDARKEAFHGSNVAWVDFDGNAPDEASYTNTPSWRIRTSQEGHEHVYWKLSSPCFNAADLETINRSLTYALSADASGWDATQVLRPPQTFNHKRGAQVRILSQRDVAYDHAVFSNLPAPPPLTDTSWQPGTIPDITQVILKYPFSDQAAQLFRASLDYIANKFPSEGRSAALMQLGYFGCEMGMDDAEIYSMLLNADDRWGKFKGRDDRPRRLAEIISRARVKHPSQEQDDARFETFMFGYQDFLNTEIEVDWVLERDEENQVGMLMEQGTMLLTGPSGLGKTQISLMFALHIALGKPFLGYSVKQPRRINFLSLEMGHAAIKFFVEQMDGNWNDEERSLLQENFIIIPVGEPWALDKPYAQTNLKRILDETQAEGLFVDSIGSAISGRISDEGPVKDLVGFNDHLLQQYGIFTWWIHHMRKSQGDNKRPEAQDDVYGNQYLVNRASNVYALLRSSDHRLRVKNLKTRMTPMEEEYKVKRLPNLMFERMIGTSAAADGIVESLTFTPDEETKGPKLPPGLGKL